MLGVGAAPGHSGPTTAATPSRAAIRAAEAGATRGDAPDVGRGTRVRQPSTACWRPTVRPRPSSSSRPAIPGGGASCGALVRTGSRPGARRAGPPGSSRDWRPLPATPPRSLPASRSLGLTWLTTDDRAYPARLRAARGTAAGPLRARLDGGALGVRRRSRSSGTRHPSEAGRRVAARIADALARLGVTVVSGLGGRDRRCGARGDGPRRWIDRGGPRLAATSSSSREPIDRLARADRRDGRGHRLGAAAGRDSDAGHVPATQPGDQRPLGRDDRGRGGGSQRGPDHGRMGARAGPRVLRRARPDRRADLGRLPRLPARVSRPGPDRGRDRRAASRISGSPAGLVAEQAGHGRPPVVAAPGRRHRRRSWPRLGSAERSVARCPARWLGDGRRPRLARPD